MWSGFGNMGGFGFGWMWILNLLFWGLIIWLVVALVHRLSDGGCKHCQGGRHWKKSDGAIEILKERYAKGEISKEEFDRMKKDLE